MVKSHRIALFSKGLNVDELFRDVILDMTSRLMKIAK